MNIAVLGSGTIGQSWCALVIAVGYEQNAYEPEPRRELEIEDLLLILSQHSEHLVFRMRVH